MKNLVMFLSLLVLVVSCGTNMVKQRVLAEQEVIEDTIKEDRIIGSDLPSWTEKSGIENGMVYVVGKAEFDANKSPFYVEKAAGMDADMKLFSDAPTDVRILTQSALTGAGIDSAEFYQIQTKLQEVIGVTGIRHDSEKVTCRKIIRYGDLSARLTRACWVQASISVRELMKAYRRTLALKFGEYKANEFKDKMDAELKKINNNPLVRSRDEKAINMPNRNDSDNNVNKRKSLRLPTKQAEVRKAKPEVSSIDSKGKDLSGSKVKAKTTDARSRIPATDKVKGSSKIDKPKLSKATDIVKKLKGKRRSLVKI